MKPLIIACLLTGFFETAAQPIYTPSPENINTRKTFQDNKYGLFIHWGLSSVLGHGEWVMNNRRIKIEEYRRYLRVFNAVDFDAEEWVM